MSHGAKQLADDDDDMCPNCCTPWKCNGPHLTRYHTAPRDPKTDMWLCEECMEIVNDEMHQLRCACVRADEMAAGVAAAIGDM